MAEDLAGETSLSACQRLADADRKIEAVPEASARADAARRIAEAKREAAEEAKGEAATQAEEDATVAEQAAEEAAKSVAVAEADALAARAVSVDPETRRECVERGFGAELQSLSGDLLQTLGQVVVDKALQSGWSVLERRLERLAGCDEAADTNKLASTCDLLDDSDLEDLIAEPELLLRSVVSDLLTQNLRTTLDLPKSLGSVANGLARGFTDAIGVWRRGGEAAFFEAFVRSMEKQLAEAASKSECASSSSNASKILWIAGQCVIEEGTGQITSFSRCDIDAKIDACFPDGEETITEIERKTRHTLLAAADAFAGKAEVSLEAKASALLNLYFDVVDQALEDQALKESENIRRTVAAFRTLSIGLVTGDWTQAMVGAGEVIDVIDFESCKNADEVLECKASRKRLYSLLSGVGHYAASYSADDPDQAVEARKAAIESIIARMVRRSDRTSGAVFSLGGSFGLTGGYRSGVKLGSNGSFAGPFQLALGAGLDTYHEKRVGFHAELSAFDLGQYVSFENSEFEVAEPDVRAALAPGVKAGVWFGSRETPVFVAPYVSLSPFVKTESGDMTWQVGGVLGVYIPFLDFN